MKSCIIVGGADISDYRIIKERLALELLKEPFVIFCDSGLRHSGPLGLKPDLIVADFDSSEDPHLPVETIRLPREKDDTDTFYAAKEALKRGYESFTLIGVVGGRFDHSLGNISILLFLDNRGKCARIIDDHSEMEIIKEQPVYVEDSYEYFSLIAIAGCAEGMTIRNAKFPLEDGKINPEYQYGISNEVLPGKKAMVSVGDGKLLLVKVFNERKEGCKYGQN